jgi:hypothetical protein
MVCDDRAVPDRLVKGQCRHDSNAVNDLKVQDINE